MDTTIKNISKSQKINSNEKDVVLSENKLANKNEINRTSHTENKLTNKKSAISSTNKKNKPKNEKDFLNQSNGGLITKSVQQVIHESMLPYSEFVILDRALPRVEDGLKPVQRRVLYSMLEVGVMPDRPYRKSARIVGDCMGKYHPHGDSSIYETMVRMAQNFNMGEVLVDGHGNFGSIDGDGAAAMRYTEAKLAPLSLELLRDIEKETVSWSLNFDDSCKEPDMLPGRFPNLLVNGSTGIAVGLATNIPTHNLREAINAVCAYIDNKNISLDEILKILPGPDFPTGAFIVNTSEIRQYFETGRGKIIMRSKLHIETAENGKKNIVITGIPFQVNKASMLQKIATLKENDNSGILSAINEIVDESDRNGIRAVIKLKKDAKVKNILNYLFKTSQLQTTFNVNMVAIADGRPKLLNLLDIIKYYVNFQQQVVCKRTQYDLEACIKKAHILEGLFIAINNIDEVIKIIKLSKSVIDAKIKLIQRFNFSDIQAQAILDMRLARLTNLEVNKLIAELERLKDLIKRFQAILKSPALQMKIVKQEMSEISKQYGVDRRTQFCNDELDLPEDVENYTDDDDAELTNIIVTPSRTIKNVNMKSYNLASKELGVSAQIYEIPEYSMRIENNKNIYLFTNFGNCIRLKVAQIEKCKFKEKGANISNYWKNLDDGEKIVSILAFEQINSNDELIFITKLGMIKLSKVEDYFATKQVIQAIKLKENDQLLKVDFNKSNTNVALFTKKGIVALVSKNDISASSRVSIGVKGISLNENDAVVSVLQTSMSDAFTIFGNNGVMKLVRVSNVPLIQRNKKGVRIIPLKLKCNIIKAESLSANINYVIEKTSGELIYLPSTEIPLDTIEGGGKFLKGLKGENIITTIYNYVTN